MYTQTHTYVYTYLYIHVLEILELLHVDFRKKRGLSRHAAWIRMSTQKLAFLC